MSLPRFFVDSDLRVGMQMALPDDVGHHALRVLRLPVGAQLTLFNGRGGEHRARIDSAAKQVTAKVEAFVDVERESPLAVTLVQAWVATDKLDWIVEKAVELGVSQVVLMPAARSVVRMDAQRRAKRVAHLHLLAIAACAQCGRNRVPALTAVDDFAQAVARTAGERFILRPDAVEPLTGSVTASGTATLLIGPEGGFDDAEVRTAERHGFRSVRFGPRVLRTETAGIAALAAIQAAAGDLGR